MDEIRKQLDRLLKKHGYGFQYSVLKLVHELAPKKSPWRFDVSEFPVEVQGARTKIDFMLRLKNTQIFIVAECKRADPKFSNWCFVKAPYVRRRRSTEEFFVDRVRYDKTNQMCRVVQDKLDIYLPKRNVFHYGFVVKTKEKGEGGKSERDVIEEAATQVCRGVNGLIDLGSSQPGLVWLGADNDIGTVFIPVVFTTAKLYSCQSDLSLANLENGNLEISEGDLAEEQFVYYQYHLSPGIKHSAHTEQSGKRFSDILVYDYVRTIPIVTATGIGDFLCSFGGDLLG